MSSTRWTPATAYIAEKLNAYTSMVNAPPALAPNDVARDVLLLQCHPVETSYSNAIASVVQRGLKAAGHEVRLRRLYFQGDASQCYGGGTFNPVFSREEQLDYHDPESTLLRETTEGLRGLESTAEDVAQAVEDLRWCDSLVLVYPTWHFSFPAALKGYFDRVMLPGVAFRLPAEATQVTGRTGLLAGLTNVTKIGVVTTYGASRLAVLGAGDNPRRWISRGFRALCAPNCQLLWHGIYGMHVQTDANRKAFLRQVETAYSTF